MSVAIVTGSAGLIGSEAVRHFAGARTRRGRHRQRHAQAVLRRRGVHGVERAAADQRARRRVHPSRRGHPRPGRAGGDLRPLRPRHRRGDPHSRPAQSTTGPLRDPFTDFDVNAVGTLNVLQNVARALHRRAVDPLLHQQGVRRPAQLAAAGRAGDAVGDRAGPPVRAGHPRGHVDRRLPALGVRRVQGRRRRDGPGVRAVLRHEDRLLPRRHADRPGPLGHRTARLPRRT